MVSSGIPARNPRHAPELADMALTLCHGVTKFKVNISLKYVLLSDWAAVMFREIIYVIYC